MMDSHQTRNDIESYIRIKMATGKYYQMFPNVKGGICFCINASKCKANLPKAPEVIVSQLWVLKIKRLSQKGG